MTAGRGKAEGIIIIIQHIFFKSVIKEEYGDL